MKKFLIGPATLFSAAFLSATAISSQASAQDLQSFVDDISVSVSTDYVSEYVFRGVSFSNTAVQPGISFSSNGFSLGAWASVPIGETADAGLDEIDVYGGYGWSFTDLVSASVGFTIYHFPETDGGLFDFDENNLASTFEVNAGLSFNTVLSPSVTAYYDFTLEGFTLQGSVSHSVPLANKVSANFGLTSGFVTLGNGAQDYQWGTGTASLNYAFNDASSMYVGANYTLNSEDFLDFPTAGDFTPNDNLFWAGVGFSTGF